MSKKKEKNKKTVKVRIGFIKPTTQNLLKYSLVLRTKTVQSLQNEFRNQFLVAQRFGFCFGK